MLRSILVGLDGSQYSQSAVDLGIRWAQRFDALLVGLGVIDQPAICKPEPISLGAGGFKKHRDEVLLVHARQRVEQFLEKFVLQCAEAQVAAKLLEDVGDPYEQILLEAQRYDLILLGQQTYFHFETQEGPGETLHQVLKHSSRPVVAVPEKLNAGGRVVIAYDGGIPAARTLQAFESLGLGQSQEVHVVSVHAHQVDAARVADRAVEFLRLHEIVAHPYALASSGAVAPLLIEQARQLEASLLVMGAYGHSSLREFLFGSVTEKLLKDIAVPLFLYH